MYRLRIYERGERAVNRSMRRRLQRGRRAAIVAVVSGAIVSTPLASSLSAITPGCTPNHWWSALRHLSFGPTYTGMYGTWNRAPMSAFLANGSNQQWLNSEMWFVRLDLDAWVETGVTAGWLTPAGTTGYFAYYAYNTDANVYSEGLIGSLTPNAGVTDEYQISRSGTTNKFTVWFDGQQFGTPDVGFWDANLLQMGGEVYTELVVRR